MNRRVDIRFEVTEANQLTDSVTFLKVRPEDNRTLPEIYPGQFVNIRVKGEEIFLRRPISICNYDNINNEIWLIIKNVGKGSNILCKTERGEVIDILLPLGRGFTLPKTTNSKILLLGGGVGTAPLYFLGKWLKMLDIRPSFLLAARTKDELFFIEEFKKLGNVYISTDNGTEGSKGLITENKLLEESWDNFYVCGPAPMMKAIARIARERNIECEVSLENRMACGLGACLCCVEDTVRGNVCTCTEGPVFNIKNLKW